MTMMTLQPIHERVDLRGVHEGGPTVYVTVCDFVFAFHTHDQLLYIQFFSLSLSLSLSLFPLTITIFSASHSLFLYRRIPFLPPFVAAFPPLPSEAHLPEGEARRGDAPHSLIRSVVVGAFWWEEVHAARSTPALTDSLVLATLPVWITHDATTPMRHSGAWVTRGHPWTKCHSPGCVILLPVTLFWSFVKLFGFLRAHLWKFLYQFSPGTFTTGPDLKMRSERSNCFALR